MVLQTGKGGEVKCELARCRWALSSASRRSSQGVTGILIPVTKGLCSMSCRFSRQQADKSVRALKGSSDPVIASRVGAMVMEEEVVMTAATTGVSCMQYLISCLMYLLQQPVNAG